MQATITPPIASRDKEPNLWHSGFMNEKATCSKARTVLESTEHGQRLLVAEDILRLIAQGELVNLKRVVANSVFAARAITDTEAFEKSTNSEPDRADLLNASEPSAYLMMNLLGVPQATLFYSKSSGIAEAQLFGAYFPKLISMVYSAIGLDVERASELDRETLEKLLRAGLEL